MKLVIHSTVQDRLYLLQVMSIRKYLRRAKMNLLEEMEIASFSIWLPQPVLNAIRMGWIWKQEPAEVGEVESQSYDVEINKLKITLGHLETLEIEIETPIALRDPIYGGRKKTPLALTGLVTPIRDPYGPEAWLLALACNCSIFSCQTREYLRDAQTHVVELLEKVSSSLRDEVDPLTAFQTLTTLQMALYKTRETEQLKGDQLIIIQSAMLASMSFHLNLKLAKSYLKKIEAWRNGTGSNPELDLNLLIDEDKD